MLFNIGDLVTRNSYNNDVIFRIVDIDDDIALGHRRLSIIDLESGNQPMFNEDKSLVVIFNGEIYNYKELKSELEKKYNFKTTSDTEVLLYGYQEYKEDIVNKLRGMFAFAIYNVKEKELFILKSWILIKNLIQKKIVLK